jgi:hypothetical protein
VKKIVKNLLYPVSDKDIKAMRDQLENGTNPVSYKSKIRKSIYNKVVLNKNKKKKIEIEK